MDLDDGVGVADGAAVAGVQVGDTLGTGLHLKTVEIDEMRIFLGNRVVLWIFNIFAQTPCNKDIKRFSFDYQGHFFFITEMEII